MSGNMYENVVTWNPLAGECIHKCSYCYMETMRKRYNNPKWCGEPRIDEKALDGFKPKRGATVFVQSINDLFAKNVPDIMIDQIVSKAREYAELSGAQFLFQSRNVRRMSYWANGWHDNRLPEGSLVGTTVESDNDTITCGMYSATARCEWLRLVIDGYTKFVTIEPIMRFDLWNLLALIQQSDATRVHIGANSKGGAAYPEPTAEEVLALIGELEASGIQVIQKSNLARLLKGSAK